MTLSIRHKVSIVFNIKLLRWYDYDRGCVTYPTQMYSSLIMLYFYFTCSPYDVNAFQSV